MTKEEAQNKHANLVQTITKYDRAYDQGQALVSDFEYDKIESELLRLEDAFPSLVTADSPSQRIRSEPITKFERRNHLVPMLSLEKIQAASNPTKEEEPDTTTRLRKQDENTIGELRKFDQQIRRHLGVSEIDYAIEPKVDGVSISVTYREGILEMGMTRGDGKAGDVITNNIKTIRSIPLKLDTPNPPKLLEVRGEAFIEISKFESLNELREQQGQPRLPNARNATAGMLKQLDPKGNNSKFLGAVFYSFGACEGIEFSSHEQLHNTLKNYGIPLQKFAQTCEGIDEALSAYSSDIVAHYEEANDLRTKVPYEIDGVVFKVDRISDWEFIPSKTKAPGYALVHKPIHWITPANSRIKGITVQVGRTGALTPVAELEPTFVQGSTVSRATLHNEDEINRKDIRVGDTVVIRKAGMVIPEVVEVIKSKRPSGALPFDLIVHLGGKCPACGDRISKKETSGGKADSVAWHCDNFSGCPAQVSLRLEYFAQRKALDLDSIGGTVAEKLIETGLVKDPLDLFSLTDDELSKLNLGTSEKPRLFGLKNAKKATSALNRARDLPLNRWLLALAIPDLGEQTALEVSKLHKNLKEVSESEIINLIIELNETKGKALSISPRAAANKHQDSEQKSKLQIEWKSLIEKADDFGNRLIELGAGKKASDKKNTRDVATPIGPVAAEKLNSYFKSEAGQTLLRRLEELDILPASEKSSGSDVSRNAAFDSKTFVLTGTLHSMTRGEASDAIRNLGGTVTSSISKNTDYLLAGENAGSKLEKAKKLGVPILTEKGFAELAKQEIKPTTLAENDESSLELFPPDSFQ